MLEHPRVAEINHRTMKLIVGVIAVSLAGLTSYFAKTVIASISASYYEEGVSHVIFIGFLFAISAFLLAYNGYTRLQMILSKVAGVATLCVAGFPCGCDGIHDQLVPYVHFASAAVTFAILAFFCYAFFQRAMAKSTGQAKSRAFIYAICGVVIVLAIVVLAIDHLIISLHIPRLTYYGEKTALFAFGVSWLTASHWLPFLTTEQEKAARRSGQD